MVEIPRISTYWAISTSVLVSLLVSGCAGSRGGNEIADQGITVQEAADVDSDGHEAQLRQRVRSEIRSAERREDEFRERVLFRKPYYFKEYAEYPGEGDDFEIEVRETDNQTIPYTANVVVDKIRFSTELTRNRESAREDADFLRNTGTETITYEYNNGNWRRVGSLFVADATEEYVDGEWRQVERQPIRTFDEAEPEQRGLWDRIIFWR